jgi:outer membrane protein assembly factor BamB
MTQYHKFLSFLLLMVSEMAGFFKIKTNKLSLILAVTVLGLLVLGCTGGPAYQGWSGFAGQDGTLYFGSMDGRVFEINPSVRSQKLTSLGEGEWVLPVKAPAAPGGMCGPLGCVPSAKPATIYGTPVIAGNLVYVATYAGNSGKVMAINRLAPGYDKEGIPSWNEGEWFYPRKEDKFIGAVVGGPIVVKDTLYVGSSDGKVYALDAVKGNERWEFDTGGKIWTSPAIKDNVVYISNYEHKFFAVSSMDGSLIWEIELPAAVASSPVVAGENVFFGTFDNQLYAVDGTNGNVKWTFGGGNWFWSTPVVKGDVVYAGCLDHNIYAIDASTGKELWRFTADGQIVSTPVLVSNFLVAASESGDLYILESDSGDLVRTVSIGYSVMAPLYAEENMVYVHARNRCVYGVDVQSGEKVWDFPYSDIK